MLTTNHVGNDRVSSYYIPMGYSVRFYDADFFEGSSFVVNGPYWDSYDDTEEMKCVGIPHDFNDKVSSIDVYRTDQG